MSLVVRMNAHGVAVAPPAAGKLIVSRLGRGESWVLSLLPAIKLVIEGEEIHEIDGRPYLLRPGQMLFVDRGDPYRAIVRRHVSTWACASICRSAAARRRRCSHCSVAR